MRNITLLLVTLLLFFNSLGQEKYFVAFTDKEGTPYSVSNPEQFLSQKSINRRVKQGIGIIERDLPVTPIYIEEIAQTGAKVLYPLKWFNGVVVETYSEAMVLSMLNKPFVKEVNMIFDPLASKSSMAEDDAYPAYHAKSDSQDFYDYGVSAPQVKLMKGDKLHNLGFRGKGITIAVLDAGFYLVNTLPAFDSINQNGQIVFTKDLVNPASDIYQEHSHGTKVLSSMAGYLPGLLIGTAPEADYILLRSEDTSSEQVVEEYNWAAAAELADSLGADIINSSLGYYTFDASWQDHLYSDMNGENTPCARAANFAAETGMLVVVSAGNEGDIEWKYIITPADAFGAIAAGAVDSEGSYASFSSIGPSADGRVKPDVVSMGAGTIVQLNDGTIGAVNGTSLSAPLISGMLACLWQALPNSSSADIYRYLIQSGSQFQSPNMYVGYGIPDFEIALNAINSQPFINKKLAVFPNPTSNRFTIYIPWEGVNLLDISLMDLSGRQIFAMNFTNSTSMQSFDFPSNMPSGMYLIKLAKGAEALTGKIVKVDL